MHLYSNSDVATYRVSTDDVYGLLIPHYATIPRLRMSKLFVFVKKWDWVNYKDTILICREIVLVTNMYTLVICISKRVFE